jgi:S-DNA-T family DNA segregation ATPase FtsK/SpoIIIE
MMDRPAESLVELLAQGMEIGLHVVVARSTSGAMRGMSDPLVRRMWDLGSPGLLFSCPREEGGVFTGLKPLTLPAGRAQWLDRQQGSRIVQVGLVADPRGKP